MVRVTWNPGDFGDESGAITLGEARDRMISYARDSSERVAALIAHEEEVREWAEREGHELVGYARDVKVHSLSAPMERPGFSAVVRAIENKQAASVAVYRLHRIARDFPIQDEAMRRIWDAGGRVFSLEPRDPETGELSAVEWLPDKPGSFQWNARKRYAQMAEDELYSILDRLQSGRRQKIARGGYGGGRRYHRRYGVELVHIQGRLEYRPIPSEQAVIRRIGEEHRDGSGYGSIARRLNEEGVRTVSGGRWSKKVVRDLVLRGPDRLSAIPEELTVATPLRWVERQAVSA